MCGLRGAPSLSLKTTAFLPPSSDRIRKSEHGQHRSPDKYPTSVRQVLQMLEKADHPLSRNVLQEAAGLRDREHFVKEHLDPILVAGLVEMTIPDKPRSSKQRYRLTPTGLEYLKSTKDRS